MQAMTLVLPPLRRLLGIGTVGLVDLAVIAAASLVPLGLNRFTRR
jgi:hypothetical protein